MKHSDRTVKLFFGIWAAYALFGYLKPESISGQLVDLALSVIRNGDFFLRHTAGSLDLSVREGAYVLGHFPGGALPLIVLGYFLEPVIFLLSPEKAFTLMNLASVFLVSTVFGALTAAVFYRFLGLSGFEEKDSVLFALIFAFGTMNFNYSTAMYKVNQVALYLFLAFYLLYAASLSGKKRGAWVFFLSGALCGLAFTVHPAYVSICLPLFFYALYTGGRRNIPFFLAGGAMPCMAMVLYLREVFGGLFVQPYLYREAGAVCVFTCPDMMNAAELFFGARGGLFPYLPVLLFAFPAVYAAFKRRHFLPETFFISASVLLTGALFSGWVYAAPPGDLVFPHDASIPSRFLAPLCPFIMLLAAKGAKKRKGLLFGVLAGLSVMFSYLGAQAGFIPTDTGWQLVYSIKVFISSFGMPYIFSDVLPGILGWGTFHGMISRADITAGSLLADPARFGMWGLLRGQLFLLAVFSGLVLVLIRYFRSLAGGDGSERDEGIVHS